MMWTPEQRAEAESSITAAYDALSDFVDLADDLGAEDVMHRADDLRTAVNDLYRRLP